MRHSAAARTLGLPLASVFTCFIAGDCPGRELAMDDSGLRCRYNVPSRFHPLRQLHSCQVYACGSSQPCTAAHFAVTTARPGFAPADAGRADASAAGAPRLEAGAALCKPAREPQQCDGLGI